VTLLLAPFVLRLLAVPRTALASDSADLMVGVFSSCNGRARRPINKTM